MPDTQWKLMRRVAQEAIEDFESDGDPILSEQDRTDLLDELADHFCAAFTLNEDKLTPRFFYRRQLRGKPLK